MKNLSLTLLAIVLFSFSVKAEDGKKLLENAMAKTEAYNQQKINQKSAFYIKYSVTTHSIDKAVKPNVEEVEIWKSNKSMYLKSAHIEVLSDEKYMFSVLNYQKKIYWSNSPKEVTNNQNLLQEGLLVDASFSVQKSKTLNVVSVAVSDSISAQKGVKSVEYTLNKKGLVDKVVIYYNRSKSKELNTLYVEYNFLKNSIVDAPLKLNKSSKNNFLSKGKLKLAYVNKDFQLVDYRNKTAKKTIKKNYK